MTMLDKCAREVPEAVKRIWRAMIDEALKERT